VRSKVSKSEQCIAVSINLAFHCYRELACHMGAHSTCLPHLPPAEAGTWFSDPGAIQGKVDLCYVKAHRPGINPRPVNRKSSALLQRQHATQKSIVVSMSVCLSVCLSTCTYQKTCKMFCTC